LHVNPAGNAARPNMPMVTALILFYFQKKRRLSPPRRTAALFDGRIKFSRQS
jgi:hypothetical protein